MYFLEFDRPASFSWFFEKFLRLVHVYLYNFRVVGKGSRKKNVFFSGPATTGNKGLVTKKKTTFLRL